MSRQATAAAVLILFFILATDENGESADLLVYAYDKEQAEDLWRVHFKDNDITDPKKVTPITAPASPGAVDWDLLT